jgi:fructosamine-3-kinase
VKVSLPDSCVHAVEKALAIKLTSRETLGSGDTSSAFKVVDDDGQTYCLKLSKNVPKTAFVTEAQGLEALYEKSSLIVPKVFAVFSTEDTSGIVLEYLTSVSEQNDFDVSLAAGLAQLHQNEAELFGFTDDNFIGRLPQKNKQHSTWGGFFVRQRLQYQVEVAESRGWLGKDTLRQFGDRATALEIFLDEVSEPPVLLHGDLWRGNVMASDRGAAILDPAVYFGNREAEIAFTELFGGFSKSFYTEYNRHLPLASGYESRKDFYNLYHILNHANMFGGHYCEQAMAILQRLPR